MPLDPIACLLCLYFRLVILPDPPTLVLGGELLRGAVTAEDFDLVESVSFAVILPFDPTDGPLPVDELLPRLMIDPLFCTVNGGIAFFSSIVGVRYSTDGL